MPKYAIFLKEILSNKKKLEEYGIMELNRRGSTIAIRNLPPKQKDLGSFTSPCVIGELQTKAPCDLGATINLMPLSVFMKMGINEPRKTTMSIQLADRSNVYPKGIIEDVLVRVDKFIFPVDFVVMEMEEDEEVPIILGRPFLATRKSLIVVD